MAPEVGTQRPSLHGAKLVPLYDYRCDGCGHRFEKLAPASSSESPPCPSCGNNKTNRLISSGHFILKGGGWYADGYSKPKEES